MKMYLIEMFFLRYIEDTVIKDAINSPNTCQMYKCKYITKKFIFMFF